MTKAGDVLVRVDFEVGGVKLADSVKLSELQTMIARISVEGGTLVGVRPLEDVPSGDKPELLRLNHVGEAGFEDPNAPTLNAGRQGVPQ